MTNHNDERSWDVAIVGAGVGGSTLAYELARRGHSVVVLERGKSLRSDPGVVRGEPASPYHDASARLRRGFWPEPLRNVATGGLPAFHHPIGCGTGGSSSVFSMVMERFRREDFKPRRYFRSVAESSLPERWPIDYEELAPYYAEAERLYRLRGTLDPLFESAPLLPPAEPTPKEQLYLEELRACGLHPYRFHYACERVPGCAGCTLSLCPRNCRVSAESACLVPATDRYGLDLLTECTVLELTASGRSVVELHCNHAGRARRIRARAFALAANAYLTPRLLLGSRSSEHPNGLANSSGLVGRNLMLHVSDHVFVNPKRDVASAAMNHGIGLNDFYVSEGTKLGNVHAHPLQHPVPGASGSPPGLLVFSTIVEDLPYPENRVLAPNEGTPTSYEYRVPAELRTRSRQLLERLREALQGRFETRLASATTSAGLNLSHPCGTCRAGDDFTSSVVDRNNRAHDLDNLYIVDASFFPSSGGINPSLTIAANALRVAAHLSSCL